MTEISEARERYEEKVCKDYLGIPESYCADEFSKLISNMKAGIMAVKGSSSEGKNPAQITGSSNEKVSREVLRNKSDLESFVDKYRRREQPSGGYTVLTNNGETATVSSATGVRNFVMGRKEFGFDPYPVKVRWRWGYPPLEFP